MGRLPVLILLFISTNLFAQTEYQYFSSDLDSYDCESDENATWIASNNGLVRIDRVTDEVFHFLPSNSGIKGLNIIEVEIDKNNTKWIINDYGLFSYDDENWTFVDLSELGHQEIKNLRVSDEGTIWFLVTYYITSFDRINQLVSYKNGELNLHEDLFEQSIKSFELKSDSLNYVTTIEYSNDEPTEIILHTFDGNEVTEVLTLEEIDFPLMVSKLKDNGDYYFLTRNEDPNFGFNLFRLRDGQSTLLSSEINSYLVISPNPLFVEDSNGDLWLQEINTAPSSSSFIQIQDEDLIYHTVDSLGLSFPPSQYQYILYDFDVDDNFVFRYESFRENDKTIIVNEDVTKAYDTNLSNLNDSWTYNHVIERCDGTMYFATYNNVTKFDGENWSDQGYSILSPEEPVALAVNPVNCDLWIGDEDEDYVVRVSENGGSIKIPVENKVINIVCDEIGNTYIMFREGLMVIDINYEQQWFEHEFPFFYSGCDEIEIGLFNSLWCHFTNGYIARFDDQIWTLFDPKDYPFADRYNLPMVMDDELTLWTYNDSGLASFDGFSWNSIPFNFNGNIPKKMVMDNSNRLWIVTNNGIIIYDGSSFEELNVQNSPLASHDILNLYFTESGIGWILDENVIIRFGENLSSSTVEIETTDFFNIYPNPSSGVFTIDVLEDGIKDAEISIYDLQGILLSEHPIASFPFSFTIENNGMYITNIKHKGASYSYKLVKTE